MKMETGSQYKYEHPHIPGKMVSRQRVCQILNEDAGLCRVCGDPAILNGKHCMAHTVIVRLRSRVKNKSKKRNPNAWKENKPDLSEADFLQPIPVIAKQYGTSRGVVRGYMIRNKIRSRKERGRPKKVEDWSGVNWAQRNEAIAVQVGVGYSTVLAKRKELGIQSWQKMAKVGFSEITT